jgi:hypothetical protein
LSVPEGLRTAITADSLITAIGPACKPPEYNGKSCNPAIEHFGCHSGSFSRRMVSGSLLGHSQVNAKRRVLEGFGLYFVVKLEMRNSTNKSAVTIEGSSNHQK